MTPQKTVRKVWSQTCPSASPGFSRPHSSDPSFQVSQATNRLSILRAKFCESLALKTKLASQAAELFLMGLFSLMDVFLGRPMEEILEQIPLSGEIKDALRGQGNPANLVLKLVVHYEKGSWEAVSPLITQLGLDEAEVPETYARDAEFVEYIPLACLA